ncbi:MAG: co-chaperone GroES [Coprobacillaceae bacterium]
MLKPLNKNIILQKEKAENTTASGIILTNENENVPNVANVIAVSIDASVQLKPGFKVVYKDYAGTTITMQDEEYIVIEEKDILAIVE